MNNEIFEKRLTELPFLKGETRKEKFEDYKNRVVYSIISNSCILNQYEHDIEDFNFEQHGENSVSFFFCKLSKELFKISVDVRDDYNHYINGIRLNLLDGTTISVWNNVDGYWEDI